MVCCVLDGGLGEVVDVVGEEDAEEEPAEAGAVDDDDPRRHGRPGGGGRRRDPRVRVVRGAEEAAGPCTHLTPLICGSERHAHHHKVVD